MTRLGNAASRGLDTAIGALAQLAFFIEWPSWTSEQRSEITHQLVSYWTEMLDAAVTMKSTVSCACAGDSGTYFGRAVLQRLR